PPLAQVGMTALDARDKPQVQFGLILEVSGEPILKLHRLFRRQLPHLGFDGFELAHAPSLRPLCRRRNGRSKEWSNRRALANLTAVQRSEQSPAPVRDLLTLNRPPH